MKEKTQSLIFFAVLSVAGYFAYQYVISPWLAGKPPIAENHSLYLPEACQAEGESLRAAFNRHEELGNLTESGLNGFKRDFRRCLEQRAEFADSQINEAIEIMKNSR